MIPRGPQGPIQRTYAGLIGLLGLKGSEISPNSIAGLIQGNVDVLGMLLANQWQYKNEVGSLTALSATASFQYTTVRLAVPEGKIWIVRNASALVNLLNPDTLGSWGLAFVPNQSGLAAATQIAMVRGNWAPALAALPVAIYEPATPLILRSGAAFGITYGDNVVAAPRTFSIRLQVAEVDA